MGGPICPLCECREGCGHSSQCPRKPHDCEDSPLCSPAVCFLEVGDSA